MTEYAKFENYYKKLEGVCNENGLVFSFKRTQYPIRLTVKPLSGVGEQLAMLEMADEKAYMSPEAYLSFSMEDGDLSWKTSDTFTISETLFSKLKNLYKNMHLCWVEHFFRYQIENGMDVRLMPPEKDPEAEPLEDFDDEDLDEELELPEDVDELLEDDEDE